MIKLIRLEKEKRFKFWLSNNEDFLKVSNQFKEFAKKRLKIPIKLFTL